MTGSNKSLEPTNTTKTTKTTKTMKTTTTTTTKSTTASSYVPNILASASAGIVSRCLTHPLDTVKSRLQAECIYQSNIKNNVKTSMESISKNHAAATNTIKPGGGGSGGITYYRGPLDALQKTIQFEGIGGLYRGFGTIIVGGTPGTILYLCSYDICKDWLSSTVNAYNGTNHLHQQQQGKQQQNGENFMVHFVSGLVAESIACIIYVPVDVIKERLQVQRSSSVGNVGSATGETVKPVLNYRGGWDALVQISRTEGLSGIYRGYAATLGSFGPFSALYFVFYERFKVWSRNISQKEELPLHWVILSSASAGALASWMTSPLDMAKLRLQVQRGMVSSTTSTTTTTTTTNKGGLIKYRGVWDCLQHAYQQDGLRGLFRGAGARVLHFVPATTITMSCYESFRTFFQNSLE